MVGGRGLHARSIAKVLLGVLFDVVSGVNLNS